MDDRRANLIGFGVTALLVLAVAAGIFRWWDNDRRAVEYDIVMSSSSTVNIQALARKGTPEAERDFRATVRSLEAFLDRNATGKRATAVRSRLESAEFEWARSRGTVRAYAEYRQRHPQGEHAPTAWSWLASARAWLDCVRGPGRAGTDTLRRVRLDVKEWYGKKTVECVGRGFMVCGPDSTWRDTSGVSPDRGARPFARERATTLFESAGYTVSAPAANDAGGICVLEVTGIAEAAYYSPGGFKYTGGSLSASVRLVPRQETGTVRGGRFQLNRRPLGTVFSTAPEASRSSSGEPNDLSETLYQLFVSNGEFEAALASTLADLLGDEFLLDVALRQARGDFEAVRTELVRRVDGRCGRDSARWIVAFAPDGKTLLDDIGRDAVPVRQR